MRHSIQAVVWISWHGGNLGVILKLCSDVGQTRQQSLGADRLSGRTEGLPGRIASCCVGSLLLGLVDLQGGNLSCACMILHSSPQAACC